METKRKRTVSLDAQDEALIAAISLKYSPFASAHGVVRLAVKHGLRFLHDDLSVLKKDLGDDGGSKS